MEQNNEAVALGRLLDENSYTRDAVRHITIDDTISVDLIRKGKVLHEIKKSRSVEISSLAAQILSLLSSSQGRTVPSSMVRLIIRFSGKLLQLN